MFHRYYVLNGKAVDNPVTSGDGDYTQAVIWLDRADSIPLASADVREGIKVTSVVVACNYNST